jgi:hypothetical protein
VKAFVIKIQKSGVGWAFDEARFPVPSFYAIRHFTNFVELICNSHPFFRSRDCYIYLLQHIPNGFSGLTYNVLYCILSNSKKNPKQANDSPLAKDLKQTFFLRLPEM